ncbi:MAG TPA: glycosyltransferase 61 family protein [Acetobacteraceae bacterium]|nr:glycosyltransferase 61 family protein [Acetobacteraceae bacterium]
MTRFYSLDELTLLHAKDLAQRADVKQPNGAEDTVCTVFAASPESIVPPNVIYHGSHNLQPTVPNLLLDSNPGLLFPRVTPGHDIAVARLLDAMCIDGGIIIDRSSRLYSESFRQIARARHRVGLDAVTEERFRLTTVPRKFRYVSGRCIFLDGEHFAAYGHFLGEIITRLWVRAFVDLTTFTIVCGKVATPHLLPLLEPFGIRRSQVVLNDGAVICEELWVPSQSFLVRQSTTLAARSTWKVIADHYDQHHGPQRVYISRSGTGSRPLLNEAQVEQLFQSHGFQVVRPETLPVGSQVNQFRNAKWLAGCSGSNMFNCAFSGPEQRKFLLTSRNYILHTDVLLNAGAQYPLTYFIGEPEREVHVHAAWKVDLVSLETAVNDWLDQTALPHFGACETFLGRGCC